MGRLRSWLSKFWRTVKTAIGPPNTRWSVLIALSWLCVAAYAVIITGTFAGRWRVIDRPLENALNAALAAAFVALSIRYSGVLTDFYQRLTGFGITDLRVNRQGADPGLNDLWMKRITDAGEIQIVGTLSRGWFQVARDNLDNLLTQSAQARLQIYLLDPFGTIWRGLIGSGTERQSKLIDDGIEVFRTLHHLASQHPDQCIVHLYDTEPMSFVKAAGRIYLGLYLPRTSRKEVPEFTISEGSFLGRKIQESADKLMKTAPTVSALQLEHYRDVMLQHARETRHEFWSDPQVTCEFCKEMRGLPSTFTRRHAGVNRMIDVTPDVIGLPSLGPLVAGHALLLPREHATSVAKVAPAVRNNIVAAADKWADAVIQSARMPLMFEHGTPADDNAHGGCGICHCHIHLIPLPDGDAARISARLAAFLVSNGCAGALSDSSWDQLSAHADEAYLAIRAGREPLKLLRLGCTPVPSQLLRRFVAEELLVPQPKWDWRDEDTMDDTAEKQQIVDCSEKLKKLFATG